MGTVERWRTIPGYPGYKISDQGRVCSFKRVEIRILKPRIIHNHHSIQLRDIEDNKKTFQIGFLVLATFGDSPPRHRQVFYLDNDYSNNRLENLKWYEQTVKEEELDPVTIDGKEYVSIHDFANATNRSYQSIYLLAKYGTHDGSIKLESIMWNNRRLVLVSEMEKMNQIAPAGRPPKEKVSG